MGDEQPNSAPDSQDEIRQQAEALVGQVISQRYRIDALIAFGGMGTIYRGEHVLLRKRIAIKVLQPSAKDLPQLVERFRREAIVGAHVSHPNIASATDFGQLDDGSYFLVLEHIKGRTLYDLIKEEGALPVERAMGIARQVAVGLYAAHEMGIVHRDIKPHNVMLVDFLDGNRTASVPALLLGRDIVKVIDFGFARLAEERLSMVPSERPSLALGRITLAGEIFGTIAYLAPEAAMGMDAVDARSDLYALGVLMYQMLTGLHPYTETEAAPLFRAHLTRRPPAFAVRAPAVAVPADVEALTMRLLEKDPSRRFQTGIELVAAIDEAMGLTTHLNQSVGRISTPALPADLLAEAFAAKPASQRPPAPAATAAPAEPPPPPPPPPVAPASSAPLTLRSSSRVWLGGVVAGLAAAGIATALALGGGVLHLSPNPPASADPAARASATTSGNSIPSGAPGEISPLAMPVYAPRPVARASAAPSATVSATAPTASAPAEGSAAPVVVGSASIPLGPAVPTGVVPPEAASWKHRLKAAGQSRDWPNGRLAVFQLARLAPSVLIDPQVLPVVVDLATAMGQHPGPDTDALFNLLEQRAGSPGLDVLYEIVQLRGGTRAASRALAMLQQPGVLGRATKAMRIAFELRVAPCEQKNALLDRAVADGDGRVLQVFEVIRTACGTSPAYEKAYRDIYGRLSK